MGRFSRLRLFADPCHECLICRARGRVGPRRQVTGKARGPGQVQHMHQAPGGDFLLRVQLRHKGQALARLGCADQQKIIFEGGAAQRW